MVFNGCIFAAGIREEKLRWLGRLREVKEDKEIREIKEVKDNPP